MPLEGVNGPEPADLSWVFAGCSDRPGRTYWQRHGAQWRDESGYRRNWDELDDPIDTVAPAFS